MNDLKARHVHDDFDHHHSGEHAHDYDNEFDIYPQEFLKIFKNGLLFNSKIIDVREEWEFEEVKIEGSLSIPLQQLNQQVKQLQPDHTYYVICSQGFRSSYAAAYMLSLEFKDVYNIQTGLIGIIDHLGEQQSPKWLIRESDR